MTRWIRFVALNKFGSERDTLFKIATKAGITRTSDGKRYFDNSLAHLESELDKSLKRLNLDRVDLFYVHRRDEKIPIEEVTGSLTELIKKGKIKQFGFSEIAPSSLEKANLNATTINDLPNILNSNSGVTV